MTYSGERILLSSQREGQVSRFRTWVFLAVPLVAILFQVYVPMFFPFLNFLEMPLLVVVYFAIMRRNQVSGLMIGALARAGRLLQHPEYVKAAARAGGFVLKELRRDKRLLRSWREGEARLPGYLEDHAFLAWGLLDLYEATQDKAWLAEARALADAMIERFWDKDEGGFSSWRAITSP